MSMYGKAGPCKDCELRTAVCHGHKPDGSWQCQRWGEYQAGFHAREREKRAALIYNDYHRDAVRRSVKVRQKGR